MFKIGDRVRIRPYYGEAIEDLVGLKRDGIYIIHDIEIYEGEAYLVFDVIGQQINLRAEFFYPAMKIGFVLDSVEDKVDIPMELP
jgi:hypothetical protein